MGYQISYGPKFAQQKASCIPNQSFLKACWISNESFLQYYIHLEYDHGLYVV